MFDSNLMAGQEVHSGRTKMNTHTGPSAKNITMSDLDLERAIVCFNTMGMARHRDFSSRYANLVCVG